MGEVTRGIRIKAGEDRVEAIRKFCLERQDEWKQHRVNLNGTGPGVVERQRQASFCEGWIEALGEVAGLTIEEVE